MSLLKSILQVIQQELENEIMKRTGPQKQSGKEEESTESSAPEIAKTTHYDEKSKVEELEKRVVELEKSYLLMLKSQKQLTDDLGLVSQVVKQIFSIFENLKIINLEDLPKDDSEIEDSVTSDEWDEFIKNKKKKYQ